ncbi:MAG: ChaN family lipoprotein, partial [Bacteroidota bacterium]
MFFRSPIFLSLSLLLIARKSHVYFLLCCLLSSFPTWSNAQSTSSSVDYKIYSTKKETMLSLDELVQEVADIDVLFFGEEHNDKIAHWLQDTIYQLLLAEYGSVALSLEMFETDCQQVLNEYLNGFITEAKFTNDARAWNNYAT